MDAPLSALSPSTFDIVAAVVCGATLATISAINLLQSFKLERVFYPIEQFVTPEDVATGRAEEYEDKIKLAALSGDTTTLSAYTSEPNVPVSESTPLLKPSTSIPIPPRRHSWRSTTFFIIGVIQTVVRLVILISIGRKVTKDIFPTSAFACPIIIETAWVYASLNPLFRPQITAPYSLLTIYMGTLVSALGVFYDAFTPGRSAQASVSNADLTFQVFSAVLSLSGTAIIMAMPLAEMDEPTEENGFQPAWEDYTTLLGWFSFVWMSPMVAIGITRPLEESDVWQLSHLMRSRVLMAKFRHLKRSTLLRRILVANALDITIDITLTAISAVLEVVRPFLLSLLLRSLQPGEEVSIQSLSMLRIANTIPQSVYAVPEMLYTIGSSSYRGLSFTGIHTAASSSSEPEDATIRRQMAYFYAGATFLCSLVRSQVELQHLYYSRRASIRTQTELIAAVYEKSLVRKDVTGQVASDQKPKKGSPVKKDDEPVKSADIGKIVSLIATDASIIARAFNMMTRLYEIPVDIIGAAYILYMLMGWSAFDGYLIFALATPLNYFLIKQLFAVRRILLNVRDKRMREMNQAIQAIKFIKYFAWESRWIDRIMAARFREIAWLRKAKILNFWLSFFWDVIPLIVSSISFCVYVLVAKGELTVAIAFPALQIFNLLTRAFTRIPALSNRLIQLYASVLRIEKYFEEDEVPDRGSWLSKSRMSHNKPDGTFDGRVGFKNASFRWTSAKKIVEKPKGKKVSIFVRVKEAIIFWKETANTPKNNTLENDEVPPKDFELRDLDLMFKRGKLNLVSGPTGSGKSSLIAALLGEMNLVAGDVYLPKVATRVDPDTGLREDVSFCTQQPWLQHQSIRENILFGLAFQEKRYNDVLEACALLPDLALFDDADQTEIGEKGISLSGGQKARVALARAVYAPSKTIILDDVLSAVDSHTAEQLINDCICGPLFADRTVILVTHHVDLVVNHCAYVIQLEDGAISAQGTPEELRSRGLLNVVHNLADKTRSPTGEVVPDPEFAATPALTGGKVIAKANDKKAMNKLVGKEGKAQGRVALKIYHVYLSASSYLLFTISVTLLFLYGVGQATQKFWLRFWGEAYETANHQGRFLTAVSWPDFPHPKDNVLPYLGVFVMLQLLSSIFYIFSQVPSIFAALRSSRRLYRAMLMRVIRAPSRWFDKTPSGRILNRFSKDIDTIDGGLQQSIMDALDWLVLTSVSVITVLYGAPAFIVPFVIILAFQYWFSQGYVSVSRDLRRIESTTRSPIIASFSEVISGLTTVRAFGAERFFVNNLFERLDRVQAANYYYWMCNRWLLFRIDSLGAFIVLFATIMSISTGASPGLVGVVVSQAQGITYGFYWLLRMYAEIEQSLNSVERVHEYMDLPSEPALIIEGSRPAAAWPTSSGGVHVEDLVLKYSPELEPVLKNVSFDIKPQEKIGLVGRTGSGKSTLALAFFRFVDFEHGKIIIDGVDITSIGLHDLRSRVTIIPQDAVLFAGTIRENLDPFDEYTDEECIDSLTRVQLRTSTFPGNTAVTTRAASPSEDEHSDAPNNSTSNMVTSAVDRNNKIIITLDTAVSEGGNNFSSGQRQLIAMARALLRRSQFIVMDESTASIDYTTDMKIQQAIREEFKESILVTIAHRLRTIIDYGRILVLDAGQVAEFDTPANLIAREDSIFHSMCIKSGDLEGLREAVQNKALWGN